MRLKTYFASGVDAAMNLARTELGPEAMLVHSKKATGDARALGEYEVVFALSDEAAPAPVTAEAPKAAPALITPSEDFTGLREAVEKTLRLVRRSEALHTTQSRLAGIEADLAAVLEDAGFSPEFRAVVLRECCAPGSKVRKSCIDWLQRQLKTNPRIGKAGSMRKVVAVLGPPGAGKTTTLIKLAARFGISGRRPSQFLALDSDRVGATDLLRSNAAVLGIGFQSIDSPHGLSQALAEHTNKDLILIDTPGIGANAAGDEGDLMTFFNDRPDIDKHLVLSADVSVRCMRRLADRFERFRPDGLIVTRMDEAGEEIGPAIEVAIQCGLPWSFVGTGQRAPEDLEAASTAAYLERMLPAWLDEVRTQQQTKHAVA
jgi:flagellar biosynthesis protein FlhF